MLYELYGEERALIVEAMRSARAALFAATAALLEAAGAEEAGPGRPRRRRGRRPRTARRMMRRHTLRCHTRRCVKLRKEEARAELLAVAGLSATMKTMTGEVSFEPGAGA